MDRRLALALTLMMGDYKTRLETDFEAAGRRCEYAMGMLSRAENGDHVPFDQRHWWLKVQERKRFQEGIARQIAIVEEALECLREAVGR